MSARLRRDRRRRHDAVHAGTRRPTARRCAGLSSFFVALLATAAPMSARGGDDTKKAACLAAHEATQEDRSAGKLRAALAAAEACAQSDCPKLVVEDCAKWAPELEALVPTVVLDVVGPGGAAITDVRVSFDGEQLVDRLDGREVAVDPGEHVLRFERAGSAPVDLKLVILERDRARRVRVELRATEAAPPAPRAIGSDGAPPSDRRTIPPGSYRPIPMPAVIVAGAGVLALGSFAFFGISGLEARSDLIDRQCSPHCPKADVDATFGKLVAADVSLGVAVVSLGVATVLYLTRPAAKRTRADR